MKWVLTIFLLLVAVPLQAARQEAGGELYENLDLFTKALHFVRENYVEEPNDKELLSGAIHGMLSTLDPHSVFMPPADYRELQLDTKGRFGGIGIEVTIKDDWLTVIAPIEGTPASQVGIRAGDRILKINGKSTKGMSLSDAVKLMRGRRGSRVLLVIGRKDRKQPLQVSLQRDVIRILSVRGIEELGDGLAYIRISAFQQDTSKSLDQALQKLEGPDGSALKGLIIDLRNNPGGLLNEAIAVADRFLQEGVIVSTKGRTQNLLEQFAHAEGTHPAYPIVLLVNEGSASAAEIVAGALQDHGRAVLVGTKTFGKGSVQTIFELGDGAALKLTVARYYTPSGRSIQDEGVHPDIVVKSEPKEVEIKKDSETPAEEVTAAVIEVEEDRQKQAAIDYLRKTVSTAKSPLGEVAP